MKLSIDLETVKNPKLYLQPDKLVIINKPPKAFFYLVIVHIAFLLMVYFEPYKIEKIPLMLLLVVLLLYWFYKSITTNKTTFDRKKQNIIFNTSNPVKKLVWKVLEYREKLSYKNITNVYVEERALIKTSFLKHLVILETDDPYKIPIATFNEQVDAESFAKDIKLELFKK